ncbi:MAG: molybdopterin-dependent oxidoreductase [Chloroflexi bacterium]|nr:molybdopterin-dependent oxidoreductase [Chloroflexota bacterium]
MTDRPSAAPHSTTDEDVWIPSSCRVCPNSCGVVVHRKNGVIVKIEGNPNNPHNFGRLCPKGLAHIMHLYDPNRVLKPLRRTNPKKGIGIDPGWREVSWDEALSEAVACIQKAVAEDPRKLVMYQGTGETEWAISAWNSFAEVMGTPNNSMGGFSGSHSPLCYLNTGSMHTEVDWPRCRMLILFGCQKGSASGHDLTKSAQTFAEARARGMKLVVVDPVCTPIASKAQRWVPIRPGTDGAFALSMMHVLVNEAGLYDRPFLQAHTNGPYLVDSSGHYVRDAATGKPLVWNLDPDAIGALAFDDPQASNPALEGDFEVAGKVCHPGFQRLKDHLKGYAPERVAQTTTVPAETIRRLAIEFGETAAIGSTITIEGQTMPFRPVCAYPDTQGATAHKYGLWAGTAIQMLNVVVGSVDMPGGVVSTNIVGPGGQMRVRPSADGIIATGAPELPSTDAPYPAHKVAPPQTVHLRELFPTGHANASVMLGLTLGPLARLLPYTPEVFLVNYTNTLMIGSNPGPVADALARIPFMIFMGDKLHETAEFADVFLPIQHSFERYDFPMNSLRGWVTQEHWYFTLRQPVVEPQPGPKHTVEMVLELGQRLGVLDKLEAKLDAKLGLKEPYRLDPKTRYGVPEILDRYTRTMFGADHGLDWFKKNGLVSQRRTLAERFPRALVKLPRLPVYFEYLIAAGQELGSMARELDLDLDLSGFAPLPFWGPCTAHNDPRGQEYDLFAVNYKLAFHAFSTTQGNPWLEDVTSHHPYAYKVWLNEETARRKGIAPGDGVVVESTVGTRVTAEAKLSQCIHPEVLGIAGCFGHWAKGLPVAQGKGPHFGTLVPFGLDHMDFVSNRIDSCARVKVYRAPQA